MNPKQFSIPPLLVYDEETAYAQIVVNFSHEKKWSHLAAGLTDVEEVYIIWKYDIEKVRLVYEFPDFDKAFKIQLRLANEYKFQNLGIDSVHDHKKASILFIVEHPEEKDE